MFLWSTYYVRDHPVVGKYLCDRSCIRLDATPVHLTTRKLQDHIYVCFILYVSNLIKTFFRTLAIQLSRICRRRRVSFDPIAHWLRLNLGGEIIENTKSWLFTAKSSPSIPGQCNNWQRFKFKALRGTLLQIFWLFKRSIDRLCNGSKGHLE